MDKLCTLLDLAAFGETFLAKFKCIPLNFTVLPKTGPAKLFFPFDQIHQTTVDRIIAYTNEDCTEKSRTEFSISQTIVDRSWEILFNQFQDQEKEQEEENQKEKLFDIEKRVKKIEKNLEEVLKLLQEGQN